jgi:hypothetical protein
MSSSSSGGIGIGGIIFAMIIGYNLFFDDDEDKKDVDVKKTDKPVVEETTKKSIETVKEDAKKLIEDAKKALTKVVEDYKKHNTDVDDFSNKVDAYVEKEDITQKQPKEKIESAKEEKIQTLKKDEDSLPSLQIPNKQKSSDQPLFKTIE